MTESSSTLGVMLCQVVTMVMESSSTCVSQDGAVFIVGVIGWGAQTQQQFYGYIDTGLYGEYDCDVGVRSVERGPNLSPFLQGYSYTREHRSIWAWQNDL